jgi:hypothetical protein
VRKIKKIIYFIFSFVLIFGFTSIVNASVNAVTPSTNDINRTNGWAYVDQLSQGVGTTDLKLTSTRAFYSCFEYRTDGEVSQKLTENGGNNYNINVTDGLYPYHCKNNSNSTYTIPANEYVEVRMVFGAETDERFDWTRFDVLVDTTAPAVPVLTSPADNAFINTSNFTFEWEDVVDTSTITYDWQASLSNTLASDGSFASVLASHTDLPTSSVNSPGTPDNVYYWHVRAKDAAGNYSLWSTVWKVTIDTIAPNATFSGFRDQTSAGYDNTQAIKSCGLVNTSGYIAWEWQLLNTELNPVTYAYQILSGPTAVGFSMDTLDTHIYGGIPVYGTYNVQVTGKDQSGNISSPITCSVTYQEAPTPTPIVGPPTDKDQCKKDGWKIFNTPTFKNQGECVKYIETHKEKPGKTWGFARYYKPGYYITFNVEEGKNGKPAKGNILNMTPTRSFYQGDVKCAQIDGNTAYFAAKIVRTNNTSFGPWVLIKVVDGGKLKDQIWAEFTTEDKISSWCFNPVTPTDGPFDVLMGNLEVKG